MLLKSYNLADAGHNSYTNWFPIWVYDLFTSPNSISILLFSFLLFRVYLELSRSLILSPNRFRKLPKGTTYLREQIIQVLVGFLVVSRELSI